MSINEVTTMDLKLQILHTFFFHDKKTFDFVRATKYPK